MGVGNDRLEGSFCKYKTYYHKYGNQCTLLFGSISYAGHLSSLRFAFGDCGFGSAGDL